MSWVEIVVFVVVVVVVSGHHRRCLLLLLYFVFAGRDSVVVPKTQSSAGVDTGSPLCECD